MLVITVALSLSAATEVSAFPTSPGPGTLSDRLKEVLTIIAIIALIFLAYQSLKGKKRK